MAKLRRRHLDRLSSQLDDIIDTIVAVRLDIEREAEARASIPACQDAGVCPPQLADLERVAALLTGVKVALERMGGTTLPAFREDVQALRAEMVEYARAQARTASLAEALHVPKRRDRRDKAALDEMQQLGLMDQWTEGLNEDAEAAKPKRRPGRPKKDTSQKPIDEPAQEVVEE